MFCLKPETRKNIWKKDVICGIPFVCYRKNKPFFVENFQFKNVIVDPALQNTYSLISMFWNFIYNLHFCIKIIWHTQKKKNMEHYGT